MKNEMNCDLRFFFLTKKLWVFMTCSIAKLESQANFQAKAQANCLLLNRSQESLRAVSDQLETARRVEAESRAEAERQMGQAQEAHLKYQNEIVLHAQDVEALNALKEASTAHR